MSMGQLETQKKNAAKPLVRVTVAQLVKQSMLILLALAETMFRAALTGVETSSARKVIAAKDLGMILHQVRMSVARNVNAMVVQAASREVTNVTSVCLDTASIQSLKCASLVERKIV